jgi:hypothetical protein
MIEVITVFIVWTTAQVVDGNMWLAEQKTNRTCRDNHKTIYLVPKIDLVKLGVTEDDCQTLAKGE